VAHNRSTEHRFIRSTSGAGGQPLGVPSGGACCEREPDASGGGDAVPRLLKKMSDVARGGRVRWRRYPVDGMAGLFDGDHVRRLFGYETFLRCLSLSAPHANTTAAPVACTTPTHSNIPVPTTLQSPARPTPSRPPAAASARISCSRTQHTKTSGLESAHRPTATSFTTTTTTPPPNGSSLIRFGSGRKHGESVACRIERRLVSAAVPDICALRACDAIRPPP
jgi:hypothetical protein